MFIGLTSVREERFDAVTEEFVVSSELPVDVAHVALAQLPEELLDAVDGGTAVGPWQLEIGRFGHTALA
jgi:hypothetical protein